MGPVPEPAHHEALLPIGEVVARLSRDYPEVTRSSLRFLEREGLLTAARTTGGHRLYSVADVDRIRQIKAWQAQRLSLDAIRQRLTLLDRLPAPAVLADEFLRQAAGGDSAGAYRTIISADDVGLPLMRMFGDVLQPALTELGHAWARGELLVAQEKEVSELVRDVIAELSRRHAREPSDGLSLVAACVNGERHDFGLRMMCGLLRADGHAVHFIGADVAPRFLLEAVRLHRPSAVLLSAKLPPSLPAVKDAITLLSAGNLTVPPLVVVGGTVAIEDPATFRGWGAVPISEQRLDTALAAVTSALVGVR